MCFKQTNWLKLDIIRIGAQEHVNKLAVRVNAIIRYTSRSQVYITIVCYQIVTNLPSIPWMNAVQLIIDGVVHWCPPTGFSINVLHPLYSGRLFVEFCHNRCASSSVYSISSPWPIPFFSSEFSINAGCSLIFVSLVGWALPKITSWVANSIKIQIHI